MSQSSILFGGLFIGFIVYVTMKGELTSYTNVLWGPVPASASNSTATQTAQQTANTVNQNFGSSLGSNAPATATNIITGDSNDQIGTFLTKAYNTYQQFNTWVENQ